MIVSLPKREVVPIMNLPLGTGNSVDMKPFLGNSLRKYRGIAACSLMMVSAVVYAQDQDEQDQDAPAPEPEVQQQLDRVGAEDDQKPSVLEKKTSEKRTLYFIGPKLPSQRQQGPSIGAPITIFPKPLVAKGSIVIQAPPEAGAGQTPVENPVSAEGRLSPAEGIPVEDDLEVDQLSQKEAENPERPEAEGLDTLAPERTLPLLDADADSGGVGDIDQDKIQEGLLEQIDPSGLPVLGLANPIDTVWQGYERATIQKFLQRLAKPSFSPTLTRLAASVAGSRFSLPAPNGQEDILKIIEARLAVFEASANTSAYVSLLDGLPADGDWSALASHTVRAHLLKGELTDACLIGETERAGDTDPYWVRLAAFCMAAAGNRSGVDFQLGILEETSELEPVFYQLLDQILVEAEQPPGAILPDPVTITESLQTDILTVAMARLSRAKIQEIDAQRLNPLSISMLLENPSISTDAQTMLVAYLLERGIGQEAAIASFARSFALQDGEIEAALAATDKASADDQLDGEIAEAVQELDAEQLELPAMTEGRLQAVLLAAIAGADDQDTRNRAFDRFWTRATDTGKLASAAPVLNLLTRNEASLASATPETHGQLARAAMLSGDGQFANHWSRRLRTTVAGQDAGADNALIALWPLLALGEQGTSESAASRLNLWWQQQSDNPEAYQQANLLFSVVGAKNSDVPEALWDKVAQGPATFNGAAISPALWRKFEMSVHAEDPVAALSSLYQLLSEIGPADLPPAISGVLVSGLKRLGFEDTAKALALEILISQKL